MIQLATDPMPFVKSEAASVLAMFSAKNGSSMTHRPIPAPEPSPEPNPEPDAAMNALHSHIAPTDWNELFQAITARLESCVTNPASTGSTQEHLLGGAPSIQATVLECVSALKQLHADLMRSKRIAKKLSDLT
jgi:hypothetical protein